ncbi:hypothetical protein [Pseudactinotalea terrae]|uniref:hypothetical protein n=1 Tax=Pseudactinotalea terrae TaxID=1743262 RepID=UPI0012E1C784|nr:hypothetical protein [Pseudactinotalea terrae]
MNRARVAALVALGLGAAAAVTACSSPDPAAVAAVGFDGSAYMAVLRMCDEGRSLTYVQFAEGADGDPALAWIGRTVEPITFFRIDSEPPDNWVLDVDGGLVSDVPYSFTATADDLTVAGPEVTLAELNDLEAGTVIDAAGTAQPVDDFLEQACSP